MIAAPGRTVGQALAYARRGWPVFPCQSDGKEPATRHGFHDASTDPDRIRSWWRRRPDANLAIATGLPGPDVLDVDQHGDAGSGYPALRLLKRAGLLHGAGAIVGTPRGGLHLYFTGSDQPSGRLPCRHLDFRAHGGYVLAPPSQAGGRPYRLLRRQAESGELDWAAVTGLLDPGRSRLARPWAGPAIDLSHLVGWVERLPEGNRNAGLFWAACRAVEAGQPGVLDDLAAAAAGRPHRARDQPDRRLRETRQHPPPRPAARTRGSVMASYTRPRRHEPASWPAVSGQPGLGLDGGLARAGERPPDVAPDGETARPAPSAWGTQRRLRALMNRSWSPQALEQATGIPAAMITAMLDGGRAPGRSVNERVAAAYDQLWNKPPPLDTARDRELADTARAHARKHGWPPPMAYDDDLIDLPAGDAEPGWRRSARTNRPRADLAEDLAFVREHGGYRHAPIAVAAMRLGVTPEALEQAQCRTARADREAEAG